MPSWGDRRVAHIGTLSVATFVAIVLIGSIATVAVRAAATELHMQVRAAAGESPTHAVWGEWLATQMAADLAPLDIEARGARAKELDRRADRLIEATSVVGLAGRGAALQRADSRRDHRRVRRLGRLVSD